MPRQRKGQTKDIKKTVEKPIESSMESAPEIQAEIQEENIPVSKPVDKLIEKPIQKKPNIITAEQIRSMTVIQLRAFIEAQQNPELDSLMDVYNRDLLQTKLIEKLGL